MKTDDGTAVAVAEISGAQIAHVLQLTMNATIREQSTESPANGQTSKLPTVATQERQEPTDTRLRADHAELAWLSQLPGRVAPGSGETSIEAAAENILPELRKLIRSRSLLLVRETQTSIINGTDAHDPVWACGDSISATVVAGMIGRHAAEASDAGGMCFDFTAPPYSSQSRDGVLSAILMPVHWPGRRQGWLIALNKDLRRLATGESASRYGPEIQVGDVEFGQAEFSLIRAASSVLATNCGILDLLSDRESLLTGVVRTLVNALDAKDSYTSGHSERVAEFARLTAQAMGINEKECEQVYMAGLLHDIGKVGIPDQILNKPSAVTDAEMEMIRQHPVIGYEILQHLIRFEYVLPAVLHHHESFDGTGYPAQLSGDAIPLSARILAVVDAWDAMTSNRSYRSGMLPDRATLILENGSGAQWDPQCVTAFLSCQDAVRLRMDAAHSEPTAPKMVRGAAVASMAAWPEQFAETRNWLD